MIAALFFAAVVCTTPTGSRLEFDGGYSAIVGPISDGSARKNPRRQTVRGLTLIGDWTCLGGEPEGFGGGGGGQVIICNNVLPSHHRPTKAELASIRTCRTHSRPSQ